MEKYLSERDCEVCNGYRLNEKALAVKIINLHIGEITKKSITECLDWFNSLKSKLNQSEIQIAEGIVKFLVDVFDETGESVAIATILTMVKKIDQTK